MRNELGEVRRSQVITSHGPGSLIAFRAAATVVGVSVVAAGLEEWDRWAPPPGIGNPQTIFEPRLQKQLGVEGFRLPPVAPQIAPGQHSPRAGKLVGVRYPRWLQCPSCHLIGRRGGGPRIQGTLRSTVLHVPTRPVGGTEFTRFLPGSSCSAKGDTWMSFPGSGGSIIVSSAHLDMSWSCQVVRRPVSPG